jgi:hypothetical protein
MLLFIMCTIRGHVQLTAGPYLTLLVFTPQHAVKASNEQGSTHNTVLNKKGRK